MIKHVLVLLFMCINTCTPSGGYAPYYYKTYYLTQKVDHFSFSNSDTFKQRYLVNEENWKPHKNNGIGPIFFYTGNEGDITLFGQNAGFLIDLSRIYKAMVVFAEHRYYGQSMPYGNKSFTSTEHTGYLTSSQALADYVQLCRHLRTIDGAHNSPIISFGGSYGGMLAAWFRMKYPHITQGAIAASAPILQFMGETPCNKFGELVTKDFRDCGCDEPIRQSWKALDTMAKKKNGLKWLSESWKLCKPLTVQSDLVSLKDYLTNVWTNLAMANYPYPAKFLAPLPAFPIKEVCNMMNITVVNSTSEKLLESVYKGLSIYFNYTHSSKCLDINQNADSRLDDRGWDYQACTEMVMPFCFDGKRDMFEPISWNFTQYSENCRKKWKVDPEANRIPLYYGGEDLSGASNIVFSNGLLDPWSTGGVLKNVSDSVVAVIIPDGAHHLDLRGHDPSDPPSLVNARNIEKIMISRWINEYYDKHLLLHG